MTKKKQVVLKCALLIFLLHISLKIVRNKVKINVSLCHLKYNRNISENKKGTICI